MIINDTNLLGESPIWNYFNNSIYWVDIEGKKIKCYNDNKILEYNLDIKPTCLALIDDKKIFTVVENGLGIYDFRNEEFNYLKKINLNNQRFNDGKCNKDGILHIGTMCTYKPRDPIGKIYKYINSELIEVENGLGTANGIAFDDSNNMYYSDTSIKTIFKKDKNRKFTLKTYNNYGPDGATFDIHNNYYSCLWGGNKIDIFNKQDKIINTINLNVRNPTCCCFCGEYLNKIFITSAFVNDNDNGKLIIKNNDICGKKEPVIIY